MKAKPFTDNLRHLLFHVNEMFDSDYNGILVNRYENGTKYIGSHSDDESCLSNNGVVALSFGVTRTFRIRDKMTKKIYLDIPSKSYDFIHMGGDFQKEFLHEIIKEKKIKDERISFTFRKHLS